MILSRRMFLSGGGVYCACSNCRAQPIGHGETHFRCLTVDTANIPTVDGAGNSTGSSGYVGFTPFGTAFLKDRWDARDGLTPSSSIITLGVCFLEGAPEQKQFVQDNAEKWRQGKLGTYLRFVWDVRRDESQVRVSFTKGKGNYGQVGRNGLREQNETVNIDDFDSWVVLHEFGHVLGLQHEFQNPVSGIVWNDQVVILDMMKQYGWAEEKTRRFIIERFSSDSRCMGDTGFNPESVMMYDIPARWTRNGFSATPSRDITPRDFACVSGLYAGV